MEKAFLVEGTAVERTGEGMPSVLRPDHMAEGPTMPVKEPGLEKKSKLFDLKLQDEMY